MIYRKCAIALSAILAVQLSCPAFNAMAASASGKTSRSVKSHGQITSQKKTLTKNTTLFGKAQGSGVLTAMAGGGRRELGQCPLKHTDVSAEIAGYVSRVKVKQTFANPYKEKIEALYTFPLPESAAVDSMVMKIGSRVIKGSIKKREEAKRIYDQAKARGQVASLLEQERANIFSQSVANIEPGKEIEVTLEYIDMLPFENGKYAFSFPTVVGPRFIPGKSTDGRTNNTTQVPDASKITPPVTPRGTRAGHDISIAIALDASMPMANIKSALHDIKVVRDGAERAQISLANKSTIPNKDFVLSWEVAGDSIKSGALSYRDPAKDKSGYFTMMLVPPKKVAPAKIAPKEMVFLIDCSGSQNGKPLAKAKETLNYVIDHMNPNDTFQIISFNNRSTALFDKPQLSSPEMRKRAKLYIQKLQARGGTWMAPAVERVLALKAPENRLRIVTFMTDGYVGNDMEILGLIKKTRGKSRWFPFGTGNSVNRFLIDGIAREGGGEADYVLLNSSADAVGKKFYDRISTPLLTDIKVEFDGVQVKDVYPKNLADLWARKPLYIKGRYLTPGAGTVTLSGFNGGKPYKQTLKVNFPARDTKNEGIASVWARAKVDRLMGENWIAAQRGQLDKELKDEIVEVAIKHHIMTNYTAFVAVDNQSATGGGTAKTVTVPLEMPDGVSRQNVFGGQPQVSMKRASYMAPGGYASRGRALNTRGLVYAKSAAAPAPLYRKRKQLQIVDQSPKLEESKEDRIQISPKLAPALRSIANGKTSDYRGVMKNGRIKVQLSLTSISEKIKHLLRSAGLMEIRQLGSPGSGKSVRVEGYIQATMLKRLTKLSFVKYIEPALK